MYGPFPYPSSRQQHFAPFDYRLCTLKKAGRICALPIDLSVQVEKIIVFRVMIQAFDNFVD